MSTDQSERYVLSTPAGEYVLDGTFAPSQLRPTARSSHLVRARGYRRVFNLHDGLPDPTPIVLTGMVECGTEDELALALRELRTAVRTATQLSRNDRPGQIINGASMIAAPVDDHSNVASVTLTFIPAAVPDEDSGYYDW